MITVLASIKGAPGVTSSSLALAACWPRPAVIVEADPSGGDLGYRCDALTSRAPGVSRNILTLAADVRGRNAQADTLSSHAVPLAQGVSVVRGATSIRQSRGLVGLWPSIVEAVAECPQDVIVDLGRFVPGAGPSTVLRQADLVFVVATLALESVMHLVEGLPELKREADNRELTLCPLLIAGGVGADADCWEVDRLLASRGCDVLPAVHLPVDPGSLARLERSERPDGRLSRTPLVRQARQLISALRINIDVDAGREAGDSPRTSEAPLREAPVIQQPAGAQVAALREAGLISGPKGEQTETAERLITGPPPEISRHERTGGSAPRTEVAAATRWRVPRAGEVS